MAGNGKPQPAKQGRDAKTGKYVTQAEVKRRPNTTVNETRKSK